MLFNHHVISSTKVKNAIRRVQSPLITHLQNVHINGVLHGCSGFLQDPKTGRIVYISTDVNHGTNEKILYRNARHLKDFTGGRNRYCEMSADKLISIVTEFVNSVDINDLD